MSTAAQKPKQNLFHYIITSTDSRSPREKKLKQTVIQYPRPRGSPRGRGRGSPRGRGRVSPKQTSPVTSARLRKPVKKIPVM